MTNQSHTVYVNDGADCNLNIQNTTDSTIKLSNKSIWYVNYTIYHDDRSDIKTYQGDSFEKGISSFFRIQDCFLYTLSNHVDNKTMYNDISGKAIKWLMEGITDNSHCDDPFFTERYALSVLNFAAKYHV
jgi:hypothetical protein